VTNPRIPRPGLSREHADELVASVDALREPSSPWMPLAAPVGREQTLTKGFPRAPGTGVPLPPMREKQPSLRDIDAVTAIRKPAPGNAPAPRDVAPHSATLESNEPQGVPRERLPQGRREPRSMSPAPWDPRASSPELAQAVRDMGDQLKPAPTSTPSVPPAPRPRPAIELEWWRTTSGMLKIMAAVPVMLAASTASVVAIINALRQPADPDLVKDIALARKEVAGLRRYVEQKDIAREEQTQRRLDGMNSRILDLDARYPAPKKNPRRAPKETDAAP
jgi:hypothetical protein